MIERSCPAGALPPAVYWKFSACGVTAMVAAGAAETVSVTAIDTGVFVAPVAVICTAPVYVPALSPAGDTDTERLDGAVPDAADTISHGWLELAVQPSAPLRCS